MSNRLKQGKRGARGQAMTEFFIVLPVMLLLVLGILQFALIYQAKITLNYAAFETARAGSLNNGNRNAMNLAFASSMAPLYTTSYFAFNSNKNSCTNDFKPLNTNNLNGKQVMETNLDTVTKAKANNFNPDDVICARRVVQKQISDGEVMITVVNPSPASFSDYGEKIDGKVTIPNDNLMYRNASISNSSTSLQTIQDANLLKVHIGYCYELVVPFVNKIIWMMQRYSRGASVPPNMPQINPNAFFGPAPAGFAKTCIEKSQYSGRAIVLYAQSVVRMQSPAIQCEINDPDNC
jgi:Flp pilus assembly protein TadG